MPQVMHALEASRGRTLERLRRVIVLALLLPTLAYVAVTAWLYADSFAQARAGLDRTARIGQEHALKLFDTNEMLLQRMLDLLGTREDGELLARGPELHTALRRMTADLPQVQGLYVNGADGRMVTSSVVDPPRRDIDFRDREWFVAHREARTPVFVTEQLTSRSTGEPFFDMSRRRNDLQGRFLGVVNVSLRPQYLTDFWRELGTSMAGLRVAVVRADGRVVARWPGGVAPGNDVVAAEHPLMRAIASGRRSGEVDGPSLAEGTERLRAFRRLGEYPLYLVASVDREVVLTGWRRQATLLALLAFPVSGGFAWLAWLAMRHTREELDAVQRLEDERAQRQRIELALLQSQKLEAMGRLTGGVAHDFNNLLMVVNSNLYLHRRLRPDVAASPQLAAIERAVGSGSKLTRQLLAFARKQALLPERVQLQERLPALMDLLRPLLGSGIELHCEVAEDTRPVELDAAEFELALINLAVNARDAMDGSGRLEISARNASAGEAGGGVDGEFVVIETLDSGPGISPAIADRVFEPFFTTKPIGHGTGLGLSQVQALCQGAGGFARIETKPGRGALVRLFLRAGLAPVVTEPAPVQRPRDLRGRLLLVEDNEAVAQATRDILESMGCTVECVDGGEAALRRLGDGSRVDVVLSDIEMAGAVDGITLATTLTQRADAPPVILMTGYAVRLEQAVREQLEVLPKPCSPDMLADAVAKALARRRGGAVPTTDTAAA